MSNSALPNKNTDTLLAVISTKLDNLIEIVGELKKELDSKVNLSTFEAHLKSHETYLKNLDDRLVEERKKREKTDLDIAFSKGEAKVHGGIWGTVSAVLVGVATHFFTR